MSDEAPRDPTPEAPSPLPSKQALTEGTLLQGRLRLTRLLDEDGRGQVFEAEDEALGVELAVKVLRPELASDPAARGCFAREVGRLRGLSHPNIIRVYDYGEDPTGAVFYSMELLVGQSLRGRLHGSKSGLGRNEFLEVFEQITRALEHAHRHGVFHRGLKPENIFVTDSGGIRILDLGLGTALDGYLAGNLSFGRAVYIAPEKQESGGEPDARGDVYALGVIAYELLTGRRPMGAFTPVHKLRLDIPEAIDEVLRGALSPQPEERYESVTELRAAFLAVWERRAEDELKVAGALASLGQHQRVGAAVVGILAVSLLFIGLFSISGNPLSLTVTSPDEVSIARAPEVLIEGRVSHPNAIIKALDQTTTAGDEGRFSLAVPLRIGRNDILVEALSGNETQRQLRKVFADLSPPRLSLAAPPPAETGAPTIALIGRVVDDATTPSLTLRLNGEEQSVTLDKEGNFHHKVELQEGENLLELIAKDEAERQAEPVSARVLHSPDLPK